LTRTLVFQLGCLLILPAVIGNNGIWLSATLAEILAVIVADFFIAKNRGKYQYW